MPIIYSYPVKTTPALVDTMIITDSETEDPEDVTKTVTIGSLKSLMIGNLVPATNSIDATIPIQASTNGNIITISSRVFGGETLTGHVPSSGGRDPSTNFLRADGTWAVPAGSGGGGGITEIVASSPLTGGTITSTGTIGITQAATGASGFLTSTDWNTFNNKQATLVSQSNIKSVNGVTLLGSGNLAVSASPAGSSSEIQFNDGTANLAASDKFTYNGTNTLTLGLAGETAGIYQALGDGTSSGGTFRIGHLNNSTSLNLLVSTTNMAADYNLFFPSTQSSGTQILQADSSGNFSWINTPTGGPGSGSINRIPFWNGTGTTLGSSSIIFNNSDSQVKMASAVSDDNSEIGSGTLQVIQELTDPAGAPALYLETANSNGSADGTLRTWITFFLKISGTQTHAGVLRVASSSSNIPTLAQTSDYRLKENISEYKGGLEKIYKLKPSTFSFKEGTDGGLVTGFIAHELKEHLPKLVQGSKDQVDKDGKPRYQNINQDGLIPYMVSAIKELKDEIDLLKSEIKLLKKD